MQTSLECVGVPTGSQRGGGPMRMLPAREPHVRKHRCLDAIDTIRLARCRCTDPKIFAEPSAKNASSRDAQMFNP
jgi:hypothetical protein